LYERGGFRGGAAAGDQALGDRSQLADAHIDDERSREARQRGPVERRFRLRRVLMAGEERHRARGVPMGDRDAGVGRSGHPGGDPRDDLEGDPRIHERLRLLAPST